MGILSEIKKAFGGGGDSSSAPVGKKIEFGEPTVNDKDGTRIFPQKTERHPS